MFECTIKFFINIHIFSYRNLRIYKFIYHLKEKYDLLKGRFPRLPSLSTFNRPFVKKYPLGSIVIDPYGMVQKRAITTNLIVKGGCNSEGVVGHGYRVTGLKIAPVS